MDEHIYKEHNKTLLLYHMVFPVKYRRKIFTEEVGNKLKEVCKGIGMAYEMKFVEIGMEEDLVHMLVQGIPTMSVSQMVKTIKSITAREIFKAYPRIKKEILWGGNLWTSGYYANTVGQYGSKDTIMKYIQNQGKDVKGYEKIYESQQEFDFEV